MSKCDPSYSQSHANKKENHKTKQTDQSIDVKQQQQNTQFQIGLWGR